MKHVIPAALVFGLMATSVVAQTSAPATTTQPGTAATPATPPGTTPSTMPSAITTSPSTATPASPSASTSSAPAAVSTTSEPTRTTEAPVPGANSFTEGQARSRIEERGFAQITDLKKDDQGIWRGTAMKDGKSVPVAMDFQGNIVGQ